MNVGHPLAAGFAGLHVGVAGVVVVPLVGWDTEDQSDTKLSSWLRNKASERATDPKDLVSTLCLEAP